MTGLFVGLIAVAAGILQGVTGMGGGLIQMLVLPLFFPVQLASAIAGCACLFLTAAMAFQYRKRPTSEWRSYQLCYIWQLPGWPFTFRQDGIR